MSTSHTPHTHSILPLLPRLRRRSGCVTIVQYLSSKETFLILRCSFEDKCNLLTSTYLLYLKILTFFFLFSIFSSIFPLFSLLLPFLLLSSQLLSILSLRLQPSSLIHFSCLSSTISMNYYVLTLISFNCNNVTIFIREKTFFIRNFNLLF